MKRSLLTLLLLIPLLTGALLLPPQQIDNLGSFANTLRIDLERLADELLTSAVRPEGWTSNVDIRSGTMASDLWFDLELLANEVFGAGLRPPDWFGVTSGRAEIILRNVRHDLELTADTVFRDPISGVAARPDDWRGASNRFRCTRSLQNVIRLADVRLGVRLQTLESAVNFCAAAQADIEEQLVREWNLTEDAELPNRILAVRGDLERLADEKLGLNTRPLTYIRNVDPNSPTLIGDIFLDLETLANTQLGANVRPANWIGVISNNPYIAWRNLRHDLELLADETLGLDVRPRGWQRETQLSRCEPVVQDLTRLAEDYGFTTTEYGETDFCNQIEIAANNLADNPPIEDVVQEAPDARFRAKAESAFTYLDVGATKYMGIMPPGTEFRAWYRNFGESNMMFVSGDKFAVFVDRRWTSLAQDAYDRLPTLEGVAPLTFCDANWCNGPGPTPTPTGSGPLALLLAGATPPAPPELQEIADKIQVSWNNIRVTYLSDNAAARTAQVALEICSEPAQINCEPVARVFDNAAGANKPVLSQFNGLNVFEFAYGYTSNLVVEGATLTSPDIWISDPSIR
jgi:hypothetical protein